jgi:hypothetical protein
MQTRQERDDDDRRPQRPLNSQPTPSGAQNPSVTDRFAFLAPIKAALANIHLPSRPAWLTRNPAPAAGSNRAATQAASEGVDIKRFVIPGILALVVVVLIIAPFVVRLTQSSASQPMPAWFLSPVMELNFRLAPPSWNFLVGNIGFFLPWALWMLNIPLLLWQLKKERTIANEMNDWWLVVSAAILFFFARTNPVPFGTIGGNFFAWWGGNTPIVWRPEETVPFVAFICAGMGLFASLRGVRDWTPFSMICVIIAIIWKAYDQNADASWAKIFLFVGAVAGVMEIIREPGRRQTDRAGAFGMVIGMTVVFLVSRGIILSLIRSQLEAITNPPLWFVDPGKMLYANAALVAIIGAAALAWVSRFGAGKLIFGLLRKVSSTNRDFERLTPQPDAIKFWDTTILAQYALLMVWLFTGAL